MMMMMMMMMMRKTVQTVHLELPVCSLCLDEFSFCILNKMSKHFRFRFRYLLGLEYLIHQNLKFEAIKLCDFKMDLIKW